MTTRPTVKVTAPTFKPIPTESPEESIALYHLRGHCHDTSRCPVCKEERAGRALALHAVQVALGRVTATLTGQPLDRSGS